VEDSALGVELILPVDIYQKNLRSVKYALLFFALTFLVFFFTEYLNNRWVHPIHYLLAGFGLVLFYSLLLGNIGLFVILAIVMFFSRKIDWGKAPSLRFLYPADFI
jgi:inner membrane protein involved in colicin E2 resistance